MQFKEKKIRAKSFKVFERADGVANLLTCPLAARMVLPHCHCHFCHFPRRILQHKGFQELSHHPAYNNQMALNVISLCRRKSSQRDF